MSTTTVKPIRYKLLGSSGLRVFPLCLGTMQFGEVAKEATGCGSNPDDMEKIFLKYIEAGGNFIDTAVMYQMGQSEKNIGDLIKKHNIPRDQLVIATKYAFTIRPNDPNAAGNHKKNLVQSLEKSLKALQTDYIDLFYVHFWDYTLDAEQLMRYLDDIVKSGKVLHIGISDTPAWEVSRANTIAQLRGWSPFVAYQGRYSLVDRSQDNDILPMCRKMNIAQVPWGILGQGKLTGKRTREGQSADVSRKLRDPITETEFQIQDVVIEVAKELNVSPSHVAVAWVLAQEGMTSPIIGPRTVEQLDDMLAALDVKLSAEQIARLNEASKTSPGLVFPHNFLGGSTNANPWLKMLSNKPIVIEK